MTNLTIGNHKASFTAIAYIDSYPNGDEVFQGHRGTVSLTCSATQNKSSVSFSKTTESPKSIMQRAIEKFANDCPCLTANASEKETK